MSCSGSLKKGRFGYQWQAALALVGPIYDTSVESMIFAGNLMGSNHLLHLAETKYSHKHSSACQRSSTFTGHPDKKPIIKIDKTTFLQAFKYEVNERFLQ